MSAVAHASFSLDDFADELRAAPGNTTVGHTVLFENERVKVWGIDLAPGERLPFHCHTTTYFWVCTEEGLGNQRYPSGEMDTFEFARGEVDFLDIEPGENLIHDLENAGDSRLRFVAIELKEGAAS
jgi:hypothetical protein